MYDANHSRANRYLVMYVAENGTEKNRIGIVASKKIGNSVVRHRVRRLIRETIKEAYNSEQWKKNVLRGQSVKNIGITLTRGEHTLSIRALDDNIILDQWMIDFKKNRKFYLFPID